MFAFPDDCQISWVINDHVLLRGILSVTCFVVADCKMALTEGGSFLVSSLVSLLIFSGMQVEDVAHGGVDR